MSDGKLVIEIQWHSPDAAYAAGLLRDGQPWILNGALVGMGFTHGAAVTALLDEARYLVIHGGNGLTSAPLPLADREWLFSLLDPGDTSGEMYAALQAARHTASNAARRPAADMLAAAVSPPETVPAGLADVLGTMRDRKDPPMTSPPPGTADSEREAAFQSWYSQAVLSTVTKADVGWEAFHAGWDAALVTAPPGAAAGDWALIGAALGDAAAWRRERSAVSCPACATADGGLCDDHREDRTRAGEYDDLAGRLPS